MKERNPKHPAPGHLGFGPRPVHDLHDPADEENLADQDPRCERPVPFQYVDPVFSTQEVPQGARPRLMHCRWAWTARLYSTGLVPDNPTLQGACHDHLLPNTAGLMVQPIPMKKEQTACQQP